MWVGKPFSNRNGWLCVSLSPLASAIHSHSDATRFFFLLLLHPRYINTHTYTVIEGRWKVYVFARVRSPPHSQIKCPEKTKKGAKCAAAHTHARVCVCVWVIIFIFIAAFYFPAFGNDLYHKPPPYSIPKNDNWTRCVFYYFPASPSVWVCVCVACKNVSVLVWYESREFFWGLLLPLLPLATNDFPWNGNRNQNTTTEQHFSHFAGFVCPLLREGVFLLSSSPTPPSPLLPSPSLGWTMRTFVLCLGGFLRNLLFLFCLPFFCLLSQRSMLGWWVWKIDNPPGMAGKLRFVCCDRRRFVCSFFFFLLLFSVYLGGFS